MVISHNGLVTLSTAPLKSRTSHHSRADTSQGHIVTHQSVRGCVQHDKVDEEANDYSEEEKKKKKSAELR